MIATLPRQRINRDLIIQSGILPAGSQLIQDFNWLKIVDTKKAMCESISGVRLPVMRCTGVFQRADEKNANGRVYPFRILEEAIGRLQPAIKARSVMGEFDHPPDAKIHMDRVSHLITKLYMDNKTVMGQIEVINDDRMPCGSMLACLLDRKVQVGISSRGVGDMELVMHEGEDAYLVQEGFEFINSIELGMWPSEQ